MRGNTATGWSMLVGGLLVAVLISIGLYRWDAAARTAEASLRPQPVAPLAATSPQPAPVAAIALSPQAALAVPAGGGDATAGQAVFQAKCNGCHPNGNAGIGPALNGAAFTQRYPDDAAIVSLVRTGRNGMPAFGPDQVSNADLTNVVTHLRSLSAAPVAVAGAPAPAPTNAPQPGSSATPVAAAPRPVPTVAAALPGTVPAPTPLSQQLVSSITPGLSTYMLETAKRMGRSWFAAQNNNWDEAAFEIREARGVLQQGAARSNAARQQALQAFNDGFMTPLATAAQGGDATQYQQAFRASVGACNACHASQTYGATGQSFSFIRVQVPTTSIWEVYAYAK